MRKKVLITGGAGFIGSNTADAISKNGYSVRILDNLQSEVHGGKWPKYLKSNYEKIKGDVRDPKILKKSLRGVDYVYHLAAYQDQRSDFSKFFTTNTVSTSLIYEIIVAEKLPIKKIVLASSQFVYGDGEYVCAHAGGRESFYPELRSLPDLEAGRWNVRCPHGKEAQHIPFKESQPVWPTNSYGLSKYALEMASLRLGKTYNIPTTCFRYSIVQGPRQSPRNIYSGALRIFASQAIAGLPITVYEDGLATRDFVNINDVVAANILAIKEPKTDFEVFNVGGGRAYTVLEFAEEVVKIAKSDSKITIGNFRRTDTRHAVSDISKFKKIGWSPKGGIKESITDYLKWFKSEGFEGQIDKKGLVAAAKGIH